MSENKIQENIDGDVNMDSGVAEIRQEENSLPDNTVVLKG